MGITKKELRDIIKEEVLKELQRLDEVNFSTGSGDFVTGGPSSGPAPRWLQNVMDDEAEAEADAHIRRLRNAEDARATKREKENKRRQRGYAVEEEADKLRKDAEKYLMQLSALNKKGWFTRNTPIGGNWKKQRMALLKKLSDINEEVQRLLPPPLRGYTPGKSTDWSNYYLGAYTNVEGDGNRKTYRVYALPAGRSAPTDGGVETINFHDFIQMVKDGNNR